MDGMDQSLYGDDTPDKPDKGKQTESVDEQEAMNPTALLDLKVLTGKHGPPKEGDEVVVKVVKIHGDSAEVEYAPDKPEEDHDESKPHDDIEEINSKY